MLSCVSTIIRLRNTLARLLSHYAVMHFHHSFKFGNLTYVYGQTVGREAGKGSTRRNSMNRSDPKAS
jgi:hypothetical protein